MSLFRRPALSVHALAFQSAVIQTRMSSSGASFSCNLIYLIAYFSNTYFFKQSFSIISHLDTVGWIIKGLASVPYKRCITMTLDISHKLLPLDLIIYLKGQHFTLYTVQSWSWKFKIIPAKRKLFTSMGMFIYGFSCVVEWTLKNSIVFLISKDGFKLRLHTFSNSCSQTVRCLHVHGKIRLIKKKKGV